MKRLPLVATLLVFVLLCGSLSYWGMKFFKPLNRGVALPQQQEVLEPGAGQWGSLFGQVQAEVTASNYQLKGVILAKRASESMAIVVVSGKPPQAVAIGQKIAPGTELREVHRDYVLIAESGAVRRVDLPQNAVIQLTSAAPGGMLPQPPGFPTHIRNDILPPPNYPGQSAQVVQSAQPVQPMVTPGLPVASLPAVMPTGIQQ